MDDLKSIQSHTDLQIKVSTPYKFQQYKKLYNDADSTVSKSIILSPAQSRFNLQFSKRNNKNRSKGIKKSKQINQHLRDSFINGSILGQINQSQLYMNISNSSFLVKINQLGKSFHNKEERIVKQKQKLEVQKNQEQFRNFRNFSNLNNQHAKTIQDDQKIYIFAQNDYQMNTVIQNDCKIQNNKKTTILQNDKKLQKELKKQKLQNDFIDAEKANFNKVPKKLIYLTEDLSDSYHNINGNLRKSEKKVNNSKIQKQYSFQSIIDIDIENYLQSQIISEDEEIQYSSTTNLRITQTPSLRLTKKKNVNKQKNVSFQKQLDKNTFVGQKFNKMKKQYPQVIYFEHSSLTDQEFKEAQKHFSIQKQKNQGHWKTVRWTNNEEDNQVNILDSIQSIQLQQSSFIATKRVNSSSLDKQKILSEEIKYLRQLLKEQQQKNSNLIKQEVQKQVEKRMQIYEQKQMQKIKNIIQNERLFYESKTPFKYQEQILKQLKQLIQRNNLKSKNEESNNNIKVEQKQKTVDFQQKQKQKFKYQFILNSNSKLKSY